MNQRIIKFRAWWKTGREMKDWIETRKHSLNKMSEMSWELMQFTGLKDKNGKEIWEGDIMKLIRDPLSTSLWDNMQKEVTFENGMFMIAGRTLYQSGTLYLHTFEVIGNIYENPELLK